MKKIFAVLLSVITALTLVACGENKNTDEDATNKETLVEQDDLPSDAQDSEAYAIEQIIIGTTASIETATRNEYNFDMLASGVTEMPLVYQDVKGEYHKLLADYKTNDATTWTYTVEDGMKWSDGEPVTANDILFTLKYEQANGSAIFEQQTDSEGKVTKPKYKGYKISDDGKSISLTLTTPNVRELSNMTTFRVMPEHIYDGKSNVTDEEARIGCGPYIFESFSKQAGTITFVANENFPRKPNVKKIVYRLFDNEDTMYLALQHGDIDMVWNYSAGVSGIYQDVLAEDSNLSIENVPATNVPAVLAFNNNKGFFSDINLRKAVSYILDYSAFKSYFGSEYAKVPERGFVPETTVGFKETEELETDHEKAVDFMKAAGYIKKNPDGFYEKEDGQAACFSLTVNSAKEAHVGYAEMVKTQLEKFGIKVNLDMVDKDSYNAKTSNKFSNNNITMEAAIYGYTSAGMGMGNGLGSIYIDGNHAVQGGCQVFDEEFKGIMDKMKNDNSIEEYYSDAAVLQDYYADNIPLIALYWDNMMLVYSNRFDNVTIDAVFGINNINNWFTIICKNN